MIDIAVGAEISLLLIEIRPKIEVVSRGMAYKFPHKIREYNAIGNMVANSQNPNLYCVLSQNW